MAVETLTVVTTTTNGVTTTIPIVADWGTAPIFAAIGWLVVLILLGFSLYKWFKKPQKRS